jgi:hypothetical protein
MTTHCGLFYRMCGNINTLQQHLRDSPAHNFEREDCDRTFETETALQQHLRDSSALGFTLD